MPIYHKTRLLESNLLYLLLFTDLLIESVFIQFFSDQKWSETKKNEKGGVVTTGNESS